MITVRGSNAARERRFIGGLSSGIDRAHQRAINDTGFDVRKDLIQSMKATFESPTPFTLRSIFVDKARGPSLSASVRVLPRQAEYLGIQQRGGQRTAYNEWIIIPADGTRRNRYGNLTKRARQKLFDDPRNYIIESNPSTAVIYQRRARNSKRIAVLKKVTRYKKNWPFFAIAHNSAVKHYPIRLNERLNALERRVRRQR